MSKEKKKKPRMTKDIVPDDFTLSLALVDALPVLFFGANMIIISFMFSSILFLIGALLCFFAGFTKVLWKIIVVLRKKNIWWLFMQMRIAMPIGFLLMIASVCMNHNKIQLGAAWTVMVSMPYVLFFGIGILGMILMTIFAFALNNSDLKANWIEQLTNGISQAAFFVGLLLAMLR